MLRLLRQISLRQLRASWGRTVLVVSGISTGVMLITAINIVNTSVLRSFLKTIESIAGPSILEVTLGVGEVGFDASAVEIVRRDVDVSAAVPLVRGTVSMADSPGQTLQLFGADLAAERDLERYQVRLVTDRKDILQSIVDPHSILITTSFAAERGLAVGDPIKLSAPTGIVTLTVRGLLEPQGIARAFGGRLAVMDLPAAQLALQKEGLIDQIDIVLNERAKVSAVAARLEAALPATLQVVRPAQRAQQYERIVSSFQAMLTGLSTLCLVAGIFIVYNTTSTGAVHRALVLAALRVAGAEVATLFRLLMLEALCLGGIGTFIGLVQGILLARMLTTMVTDSMGVIFQLRFPVQSLEVDFYEQAVIGLLGIGSAVFASYFAARRVAALDPLEVLRADMRSVVTPVRSTWLVTWWAILVGVSGVALVMEVQFKSIAWGNFGSTLWFASSIIVAIPLVSWVAAGLSRVLPRVFGPEGRVAAESLFRSPTRTGVTVSAIALVLTIAISVASIARSFRHSVNSYFGAGFLASDLVVSAVATEGGWLETPIPERLADEILKVPGVRGVDTLRILPGQIYRGERIAIAGCSDGLFDPARHPPSWYREGDAENAAQRIRAGEGARISTTLADLFDLHVGDELNLDTPTGRVTIGVAGVVPDYMSDRGGVGLSRRLLVKYWNDRSVNRISVFLEPGAELKDVRDRIGEKIGTRYRLKILSMRELTAYHEEMINRAFAFTDAIQLLLIVVTVAGILDLLLSAILERSRELALWRVIGADDGTVRRSVVIESATIGLMGTLLGVGVGLVTSWIWIGVNFRYLLGYHLEYHIALGMTLWYLALTMLMTVIAGYAAARRATRQPILEGVQIE
jgi:putative ABC transport system permease protein